VTDARSFLFSVGGYLVADGQGGELRVVHGIDRVSDHDDAKPMVAITAAIPGGQAITLLYDRDEASGIGCHICTMAHALRAAA
jgi:hypothetical protein